MGGLELGLSSIAITSSTAHSSPSWLLTIYCDSRFTHSLNVIFWLLNGSMIKRYLSIYSFATTLNLFIRFLK